MRIRDVLGISRKRQRQVVRLMETSLVGMFFIGLYLGSTGIVVNCAVGLGVTKLPGLLERDYGIPMDAGLTLWITAAVFLHALGTIPLPADVVALVGTVPPGAERATLYGVGGWWDHLTHALSASVVAGAGYAAIRALDEHSDAIDVPPRFTFVFVLLFVLAFGVFWEVIEFTVSELAQVAGVGSALTQYGLEDTMRDLVFDTVGAVVVAIWGTGHLTGVVDALRRRMDARESSGG
ncbi:MAG: hypothetical protein ABEJ06_06315 [Haloarculaceae archaeon]